jgi:hypothetical protein
MGDDLGEQQSVERVAEQRTGSGMAAATRRPDATSAASSRPSSNAAMSPVIAIATGR